MSGPYPYVPLPLARSIRLLKVTDCREGQDQGYPQLELSLDIFELNETCPEYVAMSYTWGPPYNDASVVEQYGKDHDRVISISHGPRPACEQRIGRNLFEALIQVHKTKWQSYIWADAICINQADNDERASQVQLMGEIYTRPKFAIAWLGFEPTTIEDILWWYGPFFEYLAGTMEAKDGEPHNQMLPGTSNKYDPDLNEYVMALEGSDISVSESRVLALQGWFANTRYWNRAWVKQELTLPKRSCFLLGPHELLPAVSDEDIEPLDLHSILYQWFGVNAETMRVLVRLNDVNHHMEMPSAPVTMTIGKFRGEMLLVDEPENPYKATRKRWFGASTDESDALAMLELLLADSGHLSATDLRDKIYSLLGVIKNCCPNCTGVFHVTYQSTLQEVLKILTVRLLTELPYMTCFALRPPARYHRLENLPSWAIDITTGFRLFIPGGLSARRLTSYNACPTRDDENAAVQISGDALTLNGYYCGDITQLARGYLLDITDPGLVHDLYGQRFLVAERIRECLALMKDMGPCYRWLDDQPICEALIQTLTLSKDSDDFHTPRVGTDAFWVFVKRCISELLHTSSQDDPTVAETASKHSRDCRDLVIALEQSGVAVSPSLLAYARHLLAEDTKIQAFEAVPTYEAETLIVRPLLVSETVLNRAVFRTNEDLLGLVADEAKPGDQLWILCRARVPQVLRPLPDGNFELLGEAYVHGGVDGELIERGIAGPLRQITIV